MLAELTEGYVAKDIDVLVNRAALATARADKDAIAQSTLATLITEGKESGELPSVPESVIRQQERTRDEFEGRKNSGRNKIGFN